MGKSLYEKVFEHHSVADLGGGVHQLLIDLHLLHEATSPQAFSMLEEMGLPMAHPEMTIATADHVVPTGRDGAASKDPLAAAMIARMRENADTYGVRYFSPEKRENGILHVIGPEVGLTQPGMTIACGDSHTSTHGAFGALGFGVGTSQIRDILATQCVAVRKLKVRRIVIDGTKRPGVFAKDIILHIIRQLGPTAGIGMAYEFAGTAVDAMSMDERMTLCNMAIEGGARVGYINPDITTFHYLQTRPESVCPKTWDEAEPLFAAIASDPDAQYDSEARFQAEDVQPMVTWGVNPGQSLGIDETVPDPNKAAWHEAAGTAETLGFMGFDAGAPIKGNKIDVAFIGSCANGRYSDFEDVANALATGRHKVAAHVRALVVPGSQSTLSRMQETGMIEIFEAAGFEVRAPGCSMCVAMNGDTLQGRELCASSSNRNFKGRQGSPDGRTLLMSPLSVAAAAVSGAVADPRDVFDFPTVQGG